jgi:hypothetical protein
VADADLLREIDKLTQDAIEMNFRGISRSLRRLVPEYDQSREPDEWIIADMGLSRDQSLERQPQAKNGS